LSLVSIPNAYISSMLLGTVEAANSQESLLRGLETAGAAER